MVDEVEKIGQLRELFANYNIDAYLLNASDIFLGEYTRKHDRRLYWLTKFSGEHTYVLVTQSQAYLFTNGIYELQAKQEVDTNLYTIHNMSRFSLNDLLKQDNNHKLRIGYDPKIFTKQSLQRYSNCNLLPIQPNLIDLIWQDRPEPIKHKAFLYEEQYSGQNYSDKLATLRARLEHHQSDYIFITDPYLVSTIFNMRSYDIANTPVMLGYALIGHTESIIFCDYQVDNQLQQYLGCDVAIKPLDKVYDDIGNLSKQKIIIDKTQISAFLIDALESLNQIIHDDQIILYASKNQIEINNSQEIHIHDGIALTNSLLQIENSDLDTMSELEISNLLIKERRKCDKFIMPSFDSIVGFNDHGAIIHYRVTEESNYPIDRDGLLLIDSGGQYLGGTTDVTRTIPIGQQRNSEIKKHYSLVLKGYIALASAKFPKNRCGMHLDALARQYLWQEGLDYQHGTGHGVGNFLCVHEGPHNIGPSLINVPLKPGMIVSIEPGFYQENHYGIRIESLAAVQTSSVNENYLEFNILTKAPINIELIDRSLLTDSEITWLNNYHQQILDDFISKHASDELLSYVRGHLITL